MHFRRRLETLRCMCNLALQSLYLLSPYPPSFLPSPTSSTKLSLPHHITTFNMTTLHPAPDMLFLTNKAFSALSQTPGTDIESWVLSGLLPPTTEKDYKHKSAAKLISKEKMVEGSHSGHMSNVDGSHSGHYGPNVDGSHSGHMGPNADGSHSGHFAPNEIGRASCRERVF